ncbi:MAG: hypothetical protein GY816_19335 [Cytophagales bacterium]|nr:hypothetical protein [Cytophagales bacterium]
MNGISYAQTSHVEIQVTVTNDGWELIGDLVLPNSEGSFPAVLLLNKAAGNREVYKNLTSHLAQRGIASLRLDLRGHGESINLGKFKPGEIHPDPIIWDAEKDVIAAIQFLKSHALIDSTSLAIVGSSYSGEEMAEAGRLNGYVQAYAALSPGSFGDESIMRIDSSKIPWLFIVSKNDQYLKEITKSVQENSQEVELIIVPGSKHASDILKDNIGIAERIAVWLAEKLQSSD